MSAALLSQAAEIMQSGMCLRQACSRRTCMSQDVMFSLETVSMPLEPEQEFQYWRGVTDAKVVLLDRALQDLQGQIRQLTERLELQTQELKKEMQQNMRLVYMIVGGGMFLATMLPWILPLLGKK